MGSTKGAPMTKDPEIPWIPLIHSVMRTRAFLAVQTTHLSAVKSGPIMTGFMYCLLCISAQKETQVLQSHMLGIWSPGKAKDEDLFAVLCLLTFNTTKSTGGLVMFLARLGAPPWHWTPRNRSSRFCPRCGVQHFRGIKVKAPEIYLSFCPTKMLWMDEIHFAPPKKPWNDDSPVNTNKHWVPMFSKWCRGVSIHSMRPWKSRSASQPGFPAVCLFPLIQGGLATTTRHAQMISTRVLKTAGLVHQLEELIDTRVGHLTKTWEGVTSRKRSSLVSNAPPKVFPSEHKNVTLCGFKGNPIVHEHDWTCPHGPRIGKPVIDLAGGVSHSSRDPSPLGKQPGQHCQNCSNAPWECRPPDSKVVPQSQIKSLDPVDSRWCKFTAPKTIELLALPTWLSWLCWPHYTNRS